jgi:hypothetical protein
MPAGPAGGPRTKEQWVSVPPDDKAEPRKDLLECAWNVAVPAVPLEDLLDTLERFSSMFTRAAGERGPCSELTLLSCSMRLNTPAGIGWLSHDLKQSRQPGVWNSVLANPAGRFV